MICVHDATTKKVKEKRNRGVRFVFSSSSRFVVTRNDAGAMLNLISMARHAWNSEVI
jgi:hypothetical protein